MLNNQVQFGEYLFNVQPIQMKYIKNNYLEYFVILYTNGKEMVQSGQKEVIELISAFISMTFREDEKALEYILENFTVEWFLALLEVVKEVNDFQEIIDMQLNPKKNDSDKKDDKPKEEKGLTLRRKYAMLSIFGHFTEMELDECTYIYFQDCMKELQIKLNWEETIAILSQTKLSEEAWESSIDQVNKSNPFNFENSQDDIIKNQGNSIEALQGLGIDINIKPSIKNDGEIVENKVKSIDDIIKEQNINVSTTTE